MKVSTKGRYALRIMIDLAQNSDRNAVSLKEIAGRQGVSAKYLELIVSTLNKAGFVNSTRGKAGGYRLARPAEEYTVGSILKLTEGNLAPVACVSDGETCCERAAECIALPMWQKLDGIIDDYLEKISLFDLIHQQAGCL